MPISNIMDPSLAASAYAKGGSMGTAKIASAPEGIKFSDFIHEGVKDAIETMKAGETMSAKAITGEAGLTDVVQAITSAELAVDTITALRDRMISAYQEIMRMPI